MSQTVYYNNEAQIRDLLTGRSIKKISEDTLELDNGLMLTLFGNEGCGGCISGWYDLTALNGCPNIITNVEFDYQPAEDDYQPAMSADVGHYKIFVFADNQKINLATFEGTDGNGYYGTGYWIEIKNGDNRR